MSDEHDQTSLSPAMVSRANWFAIRQDSFDHDLSSDDICALFNQFLMEFEKMERSGNATTTIFLDAVEQIADAVLLISPPKLLDPKVLYHPLMLFLHQMLVDILGNWRASSQRLNIQETDIFLKIVLIFVHAAEQAPELSAEQHRTKIRDILATKRFLFLVQEQVADIVLNKPDINDDPNICTLGLMTITLLQGCPFYYSVERNQQLIDDLIMNCLDSYDYVQALHQLQHDQPLTDVDRFLLYTCWEYVPFASAPASDSTGSTKADYVVQHVYDELLKRLEHAAEQPPPFTPASVAYIFERCRQILSLPNLRSFDKHANLVLDQLTKILQNQTSPAAQDESLTQVALEAFHNLSKTPDIRALMKNRQLTSLFRNYTATPNEDQHKLAFGILAEIMDEKEINKNPAEMTSIFVGQLSQLNPNEYNPDVDNALSTLKGLMQHEEAKKEIIKQGGLEKLISFVRDGDLNKQSDKQLEDALEILWLSTFDNPQVIATLQQDTKLITQVNHISHNAKHNGNVTLHKAAEGLIWKVEKEEKFKQQQQDQLEQKSKQKKQKTTTAGQAETEEEEEEEEEQYDLMISYSWADMDLAHRIFHHLTDKLGYKIWLDQEQMHGSTVEAMANAVDNAQFILMCMSETYKRSANCKCEAEYAFNRKKHIVPIKMKKDYNADGWLGFILGTRLYIDFGTYEFEKAIELLDNEIQLQKKKRKQAKESARIERQASAAVADADDKQETNGEELTSPLKTPVKKSRSISHWSEEKVHNFLFKHNLIAMVPLCDGIRGEELSGLYEMCKANSTSMYRALKFELLHGYHKILPISTFLRFMSRMRAVCDDGLPSNGSIVTKSHVDHFPEED